MTCENQKLVKLALACSAIALMASMSVHAAEADLSVRASVNAEASAETDAGNAEARGDVDAGARADTSGGVEADAKPGAEGEGDAVLENPGEEEEETPAASSGGQFLASNADAVINGSAETGGEIAGRLTTTADATLDVTTGLVDETRATAEDAIGTLEDTVDSTVTSVSDSVSATVSGEIAASVDAAVSDEIRSSVQEDLMNDVSDSLPLLGDD